MATAAERPIVEYAAMLLGAIGNVAGQILHLLGAGSVNKSWTATCAQGIHRAAIAEDRLDRNETHVRFLEGTGSAW
jgi:hypothetical protein